MEREEFWARIRKQIAGFDGEVALAAENLNSGERFDWQSERLFPPASTIKLPILCAAYYWARRGGTPLNTRIPVKAADRVGGNGVLAEFDEGLMPTLHDLMRLMIVISDNMATNLVADTVGRPRIKEFLEAKGLGVIRAERKMREPEEIEPERVNCVTARALAEILKGLARETLLEPEDCRDAVDILLRQQCNNKMPAKVINRWDLIFRRSEIRMAHKTGEIPGVEHDAGIVYLPHTSFVLVLLTCRGDNEKAISLIQDITGEFVKYYQ